MEKRILITGARGFIGSKCLSEFSNQDCEIHAVSSQVIESQSYRWHQTDLTDSQACRDLIKKVQPTHLIHAGWTAKPGVFWNDTHNLQWLTASISLFEAFFQSDHGQRIVGLGTCAEYSSHNTNDCCEVRSSTEPDTIYGSAKLSLYHAGMALASIYNKSFAWGRIFYPYGPGENERRFLPMAIQHLLNQTKMKCTHGNQIRDFIFIDDVVKSISAILDSDIQGAINIASGQGFSLRDVVTIVESELRCLKKDCILFGALATPQNEPSRVVGKINRLKNSVGYTPSYSLKKGLQILIKTYKEKR